MGERKPRRRAPKHEPEQALLERLLSALKAAGWLTMHISDSRMIVNRQGRICLAADPECAGWPDIYAVHLATGRAVAIECKRVGQGPRPNQVTWLAALAGSGVETFVATAATEAELRAELGLDVEVPVAA
jgi:hypothetical protein